MLIQPNTNAGQLSKNVATANYGLARAIKLTAIALSLRDQCLLVDGAKTIRLKKRPDFYTRIS
jgi:hypothetical protein